MTDEAMTPAEVAQVLRDHNCWRRDGFPDNAPAVHSAKRVGIAMDMAAEFIERELAKVSAR